MSRLMAGLIVVVGFVGIGSSALAQPIIVTLPNGGRVPCDHPLAIQAGLGCGAPGVVTTTPPPPPAPSQPVPAPAAPTSPFVLSHTYARVATSGERIYIAGVGTLQLPAGFPPIYVLFAQCLNGVGICTPIPGGPNPVILTLPINTNRADFVEQP